MITTAIAEHDLGILSKLNLDSIKLDKKMSAEYEPTLWRSISSEYDAINFYHKLMSLKINFSEPFKDFVRAWLYDETMHTAGFKYLYQLVYGMNEADIDCKLQQSTSDFSILEEFMQDELSISLLIAFDEIVTTFVYDRSIELYGEIEKNILPKWIKMVKRDEARHFMNIINVIKLTQQYDISHVDAILTRIINVDVNLSDYTGTFVLDHSCEEFPLSNEELTSICAKIILNKLAPKGSIYAKH